MSTLSAEWPTHHGRPCGLVVVYLPGQAVELFANFDNSFLIENRQLVGFVSQNFHSAEIPFLITIAIRHTIDDATSTSKRTVNPTWQVMFLTSDCLRGANAQRGVSSGTARAAFTDRCAARRTLSTCLATIVC